MQEIVVNCLVFVEDYPLSKRVGGVLRLCAKEIVEGQRSRHRRQPKAAVDLTCQNLKGKGS